MKIFDVIKTETQDVFLVILEERNTPIYEEVEPNLFQSSTDGIYDALNYIEGSRGAFAGREFKILMSDGTEKTIKDNCWSVLPVCEEELIAIGYATLEELQDCYVFTGGYVRKSVIEEWLSKNEPKKEYYFYEDYPTVGQARERVQKWKKENQTYYNLVMTDDPLMRISLISSMDRVKLSNERRIESLKRSMNEEYEMRMSLLAHLCRLNDIETEEEIRDFIDQTFPDKMKAILYQDLVDGLDNLIKRIIE